MAKIVSRGDPIEPVYLNNLKVAAQEWGVIFDLTVSERGAGANMSVDVAAGVAWINGTNVTKSSTTNVVITAAHASYDRYDLVIINSSGTISVIDGTAAATSYANDYDLETNNAILLAEVYVPATDTTIEDAQITDKRILFDILDPAILPPCLEEYSNHLGATDNFTSTGTTGNGAATSDAANHKMVLSTGITVVGKSWFEAKPTYTLGSKPIIANYIVQSLVDGVAGERRSSIGFHDNFGAVLETDGILFFQDSSNNWVVRTTKTGSSTSQAIADPVNGDLLTIVATSSKVTFYINGTLLFTSTTNIPTAAMQLGAGTLTTVVAATTARTIGIDMMSIKVYQ